MNRMRAIATTTMTAISFHPSDITISEVPNTHTLRSYDSTGPHIMVVARVPTSLPQLVPVIVALTPPGVHHPEFVSAEWGSVSTGI